MKAVTSLDIFELAVLRITDPMLKGLDNVTQKALTQRIIAAVLQDIVKEQFKIKQELLSGGVKPKAEVTPEPKPDEPAAPVHDEERSLLRLCHSALKNVIAAYSEEYIRPQAQPKVIQNAVACNRAIEDYFGGVVL